MSLSLSLRLEFSLRKTEFFAAFASRYPVKFFAVLDPFNGAIADKSRVPDFRFAATGVLAWEDPARMPIFCSCPVQISIDATHGVDGSTYVHHDTKR